MKKQFTFLSLLILSFAPTIYINAQATWADDIAPILYQHCTTCHHAGGIAPSSFIDYVDAVDEVLKIALLKDKVAKPLEFVLPEMKS